MILRVLLLSLLIAPALAHAWGQTGHRVTGALAERWLSPAAEAEIRALLGVEDLAEAATWADEMRSDPSPFWQRTANPWHYVTVPPGRGYADIGAPPEGDAHSALQRFAATLRDRDADPDERRLALRFAVHLIGDLHQPLHVGNGDDRGGNDVRLEFFGEPTNLHRVWDSQIIGRQTLSYSEWTDWLGRAIGAEQLAAWSEADPLVWIAESARLRPTIYPEGDEISWSYAHVHLPTIRLRLSQAGVRMAAWLNAVLEPVAGD